MNENGWILLSRKILEWQWFDKSEMVKFWLYLLLSANVEPKKWHGITIERGQLVTSVQHLTEALKLTTKQVRTALQRLKDGGEIETKTTNKYTLITICNYRSYQDYDPTQGQTNGNQRANQGQTNGNQRATTKQYNNKQYEEVASASARARERNENFSFREENADTSAYNPDNEEKEKNCAKKEKDFTPPTVEQVRQYCQMAGLLEVNPTLFVANYEENGWTTTGGRPVRNWQALAVKWNERDKKAKYSTINNTSNGNRNNKQTGAGRHASCEPRTDVSADEF